MGNGARQSNLGPKLEKRSRLGNTRRQRHYKPERSLNADEPNGEDAAEKSVGQWNGAVGGMVGRDGYRRGRGRVPGRAGEGWVAAKS